MSTQNCLFGLADACLISNDTINGLSVFTYFCGFSSLCNNLNGIYCCFNNNCNTPQNTSLIFFNATTTTTTTTPFYYSPTYSFNTSNQTTSFATLNSSNQTTTKVGNMSTSIANITTTTTSITTITTTTGGNINTSIVNTTTTTNSNTTTVWNEASFKSLISTKLIIFKIFFLFVYLL